MLKKLTKYGNSHVLVLDRAILELLNIKEGSVVKLRTDGKSLIMTPAESDSVEKVSMTYMERMAEFGEENKKKMEEITADPARKALIEEWLPGGGKFKELSQAYEPLFIKYQTELAVLASEAFIKAADELAQNYGGDRSSTEFMKEFLALRLKHAPGLAEFDREMREIGEAMGAPKDWA